MNASNSTCPINERQNGVWKALFAFEVAIFLLSTLVGTPCNLALLISTCRVKLWAKNVRRLLLCQALAICYLQLFFFYHFYSDLQYLLYQSAVPKVDWSCSAWDIFLGVFPGFFLQIFLGCLGLERFFVMRKISRQKNLQNDDDSKLSSFMILIGLALTMASATFSVLASYKRSLEACYCHIASLMSTESAIFTAVFNIFLEGGMVGLFYYILKLNRTKMADFSINTTRHNLNERFKIRETILVTEMLLPSAVLHAVCWIGFSLFGILAIAFTSVEQEFDFRSAAILQVGKFVYRE